MEELFVRNSFELFITSEMDEINNRIILNCTHTHAYWHRQPHHASIIFDYVFEPCMGAIMAANDEGAEAKTYSFF